MNHDLCKSIRNQKDLAVRVYVKPFPHVHVDVSPPFLLNSFPWRWLPERSTERGEGLRDRS